MGSHLHTFIGPLDEKNSIINNDLDDHRKMQNGPQYRSHHIRA